MLKDSVDCTYLYIKFFKKYMREKDILTNKAADR